MNAADHRGSGPLHWCDHAGSTQDVLAELLAQHTDIRHADAVATDDQRGGRGRRGRRWDAAAGQTVATSILIRPAELSGGLSGEKLPWLTLVAAAAVVELVRDWGVPASVKWPNDVMIYPDGGLTTEGKKLAGLLAQVTSDGTGVILGIGLNREFSTGTRPSEHAGALSDWLQVSPASEQVAEAVRTGVVAAVEEFSASTDPTARVRAVMHTLGQRVRAEMPDGMLVTGLASGLGESGTLKIVVEGAESPRGGLDATRSSHEKIVTGEVLEISAADVVHLRPHQ